MYTENSRPNILGRIDTCADNVVKLPLSWTDRDIWSLKYQGMCVEFSQLALGGIGPKSFIHTSVGKPISLYFYQGSIYYLLVYVFFSRLYIHVYLF